MNDTEGILHQAHTWKQEGRSVALATVLKTWGSAPRQAGSHMAINDNGDFVGSVSGGCVEGAVVDAALDVIRSAAPRVLEYGVSNDRAWEVGLACGGRIEVYVEPVAGP